ncbi:hypothetical protein NLG97_g9392 [Lecanicillium saksenae]|uniref:Uncharacterized protein n=1 Tax=Lecanicillium saksenae TaxID=468837 RepID=A0ACC1QHM0_9HYPO|nr:hypothetical protein NLG97_g9392 [Lecanicillium saksenae]
MRKSTCTVCQGIWKACTGTSASLSNNLIRGSQSGPLAQCPVHRPLVQRYTEFLHNNLEKDIKCLASEVDVRIQGGVRGQSALVWPALPGMELKWSVLLAKKGKEHPGKGRVFDSAWADLEGIKACKDKCLAVCGKSCENPLKMWKEMPDWLIDVEEQCLVTVEELDQPYVALSYVWGDAKGEQITSQTQQDLLAPGSLTDTVHISPVIKNAMEVAKRLGERYLWADALCIPRDEHPRKTRQLQMMGAIYANAVVTIVAADGHAGDALSGVTTPRTTKQTVIPFGEERLIVRDNGPWSKMRQRSEYYERGWTRQEHILARRIVTFGNGQVSWKCQTGHWHEELPLFSEVDREAEDTGLGMMMLGFPQVEMLGDVLASYNQTNLRFEEDAHPAISGLLSVLSRSFPGGFLYGLPEGLFDWALGWSAAQPAWFGLENESAGELQRRMASGRGVNLPASALPSWSWLGWRGLVRFEDEAVTMNNQGGFIIETFPVTDWYVMPEYTSPPAERRRIRSTWFENREKYKDATMMLPPGWTRHGEETLRFSDGSKFLGLDGFEGCNYTHEALKDADGGQYVFYYPFPVEEISDKSQPVIPEQMPYLFCRTKTAVLCAKRDENDRWDNKRLELCDDHGRGIGHLMLHNSSHLERFMGKDAKSVELVAVNRQIRYSKRNTIRERGEEEATEGRKRREKEEDEDKVEKAETYTVLWVEWANGVAYRLASGSVDASAWKKVALGDKDLILG